MGDVFRARDTRLGRTVAIKVIRQEFSQRADFHHRFQREARAISALNHPHVCSLYDVGEVDGFAYLVMEYVVGVTLAEVLQKGLLPLDKLLRYAVETADAVAAAHAEGIVHRDLKPANIIITAAGIKVLDFGVAKRAEPVDDDGATRTVSEQTRAGQIVGTRSYLSPEQAEGKTVDARSDIFSLGVVFYEMSAERVPSAAIRRCPSSRASCGKPRNRLERFARNFRRPSNGSSCDAWKRNQKRGSSQPANYIANWQRLRSRARAAEYHRNPL